MDKKDLEISRLTQIRELLLEDKNNLFDQLQLRQAEVESQSSMQEALQSQTGEMEYRLRETSDRVALLEEELAETRRQQDNKLTESTSASSEDVSRLVSGIETKYSARIADLQREISNVEKERAETEAGWSRKLREKSHELDLLKQTLGASTQSKQSENALVESLREQNRQLNANIENSRRQISELQAQLEQTVTAKVLLYFLLCLSCSSYPIGVCYGSVRGA